LKGKEPNYRKGTVTEKSKNLKVKKDMGSKKNKKEGKRDPRKGLTGRT